MDGGPLVLVHTEAGNLHSSLLLFVEASSSEPLLRIMLDIWFEKRPDQEAMGLLDLA